MYYTNLEHFKELSGYEIDGIWYPRVTKIVEIKAKPALYKFYAELNSFEEGELIKEKAASEGTLIHEAAEKIFIGESPEIDPSIAPSIEAFRKFIEIKNIQVDPEYIEKQIVNYDDRYAGTLDALALIDGKFGVLDIKTSQAIYRDYNLQTSAYMAALQSNFNNLQTRWILRIDQNRICLKCGSILRSKGGRDKIRIPKFPLKADSSPADKMALIMKNVNIIGPRLKAKLSLKNSLLAGRLQSVFRRKKLWEWENKYWLKQANFL